MRPTVQPVPPLTAAQTRNLLVIRVALLSIAIPAVLIPSLFQPALDAVWSWLRQRTLYKTSFFETLLTMASYAAIEAFYTRLVIDPSSPHPRIDRRPGKTHLYRNGTVLIRPYARRLRELVEYVTPLLLLDLIMVKKFRGVDAAEIARSGGYDVRSLQAHAAKAKDAVTGLTIRPTWAVPSLHNFSLRSPVQLVRALPAGAPTSREIILGLIGAMVFYDFLFFVPHILLHQVPWLWHLHIPHHTHSEIHPQVTNHLSITERMLLILAANFSLHFVRAHPLTRTIFVPLFLDLLTENHVGVELPYGYHRILPAGWVAGPAKHAEHHRGGKGGYQPYLTWADNLWVKYGNQRIGVDAAWRKVAAVDE